ncbi:hypothetical protein ACIBCT_19760 [Streptosporangium sp. NPDC050855]|uniref:hypothetical protein n=1 Tax=Streptosporangium sp. NPDC050855 TaxID=3366194 RepID=UPI0037A27442
MKQVVQVARPGMVVLCALLFLSGCRSELFPREERVDPGVVRDVRSIVKVLAETKDEVTWDGLTLVSEVLVIDVGSADSRQALSRASGLLQEHGWSIIDQQLPESVTMESSQREYVRLSLHGMEFVESVGPMDPHEERVLKDARTRGGSKALLFLELSPIG